MPSPLISMKVKASFFDRAKVKRAVDRATRITLSRSGAEVRKFAKRAMEASVRSGRIKESELDPKTRRNRKIANAILKKQGKKRLRPRKRPSKPGHAPAARRSSPLNKLTFFAYDQGRKSVVIGPVGFAGSDAPNRLEFGGRAKIGNRSVTVAKRPYMGPAMKKALPNMPRKWANSVWGG